jgi:hypothetical protein
MTVVLNADEVISGVDSYHNNHHEDRVWTFKICKISQF